MAIDNSPSSNEEVPEDQFAEELVAQVHACDPLLTRNDGEAVEEIASSPEFGMGRRVGLAIAAMSGERFREISTTMGHKDAVALASGLNQLGDHISKTEEMGRLLNAAWWRMFAALAARDDAESLDLQMLAASRDANPEEVSHG